MYWLPKCSGDRYLWKESDANGFLRALEFDLSNARRYSEYWTAAALRLAIQIWARAWKRRSWISNWRIWKQPRVSKKVLSASLFGTSVRPERIHSRHQGINRSFQATTHPADHLVSINVRA